VRAFLIAGALAAGGCLDYDALSRGAIDLAGAELSAAGDLASGDLSTSGDLAGADFAGADFAGVDLASADLASRDLAAPPDLASTDLALGPVCGAAPATCALAGLAFCEDFESATGLAGKWQSPQIIVNNTGTLGIESGTSCRGGDALHVTTQGGGNVASILSLPFSTSGSVFARAYVFVTAASESELFSVWTSGNDRVGFGVHGGQWTSLWDGAAVASTASPAFATGAWKCVELETQPGASGQVNVWIDDLPVAALGFSHANITQPNRIQLGLTPSTTQGAGDVRFDELAVDTAYVPCSR